MGDGAVLARARRAATELDGRRFADFDEICLFAEVLVALDFLPGPRDVVEYFRRPWRYTAEHEVWERSGRPSDVGGAAGEALAAVGCRRPRRHRARGRPDAPTPRRPADQGQ
ncbi:hypothetical protein [Mycolicibacterium komossense]|uniref:Uncharacterized protein n=1 Tax=Mycolicibacterium komossense TaxID=1779 RepID=A0ABT3C743_9MYCO|nr:hypothetical protein [Mycolicibacterium komossense]MCV7225278.1 hypothetical protein [Mycolicibacterium komossense]